MGLHAYAIAPPRLRRIATHLEKDAIETETSVHPYLLGENESVAKEEKRHLVYPQHECSILCLSETHKPVVCMGWMAYLVPNAFSVKSARSSRVYFQPFTSGTGSTQRSRSICTPQTHK